MGSKPGCFYAGYDGGEPVGIGGLERHGSDGLLRSVVVEKSARGDDIGAARCEALETEACARGVEGPYLLTTTAAGFFAARDDERADTGAGRDSRDHRVRGPLPRDGRPRVDPDC